MRNSLAKKTAVGDLLEASVIVARRLEVEHGLQAPYGAAAQHVKSPAAAASASQATMNTYDVVERLLGILLLVALTADDLERPVEVDELFLRQVEQSNGTERARDCRRTRQGHERRIQRQR